MITSLSLHNFKSWKLIRDAKFSKFTGLFGTNSSGKTSLIQFFLLLKQTIESSDRTQILNFGSDKDYVQLGSFPDIITSHKTNEAITFTVHFSFDEKIKIFDTAERRKVLFEDNEMEFEVSIEQTQAKRLFIKNLSYQIDQQRFHMRKQEKDKYSYKLSAKSMSENISRYQFKRTPGRPYPLSEPIKFYGFPDQVRTYYQNAGFLFDLQLQFEEFFSKVFYLGPLRDYPKRQYIWTGSQPYDMGQRGERFVDALLVSRERGDKISRGKGRGRKCLSVEEYVAFWLKKLELVTSFDIKGINGTNLYRVMVKKNENSSDVLITDVGFGVSQILPVLTLCYYVPEGSTLLIEQPEIHLHPKVQAGLADVFIDAIKVKNIQIILESHSEHLLQRLQRRIAEEEINQEFASLYFCEIKKEHSELIKLELDLFGNIINWPQNFFGDEMGDMIAMNEAIIKRKSRI